MAIANLANAGEIAGHRGHRAGGGADHRLADKSGDGVWAVVQGFLQLIGGSLAILLRGLVVTLVAIGEAEGDLAGLDQQRLERPTPPFIAADGQRPGCCRGSSAAG